MPVESAAGVVATAAFCAVAVLGDSPGLVDRTLQKALAALHDAGLNFPIIAKPDLGLCGYGVRLVADQGELWSYIAAFPVNETIVLQQWLPQIHEAGIFYVREPDASHGRITGLALRFFPQVTGDGLHTVGELATGDARLAGLLQTLRLRDSVQLQQVPQLGKSVQLATIGSTRVGGLYRDGKAFITPALTLAIDAIARDMPNFHFGRFDVRFDSLEGLGCGEGFTIMEVNGAGSEAIEAWDPETGLWAAFQMIFAKQRIVFAIGDAMRRKGFKPIGWQALARLNHQQNQLIDRYPVSN